MASTLKQKDAAPAATDPRRGSTNPHKGHQNMDTNSTAPAEAATPSLYRLLADYWVKYELLVLAMAGTDATKYGTPEHASAERKQFEAGERLDEAACAICAYVPVWSCDARFKTDFITQLARENGGSLDSEWTTALLLSLPTLCGRDEEAQS